MSAALKSLLIGSAMLAGACGGEGTKGAPANNFADAEIEALPADESSATPSDDLANGAADPQVNELNMATK